MSPSGPEISVSEVTSTSPSGVDSSSPALTGNSDSGDAGSSGAGTAGGSVGTSAAGSAGTSGSAGLGVFNTNFFCSPYNETPSSFSYCHLFHYAKIWNKLMGKEKPCVPVS